MTVKPGVSMRLYDDGAESLLKSDLFPDKVTLLPGESGAVSARERIRLMWGQDLLRDLIDGRYRTVVCGVNDADNSHGIIAHLVELIATSQWSARSVSSYARMFHESVGVHAAQDREPYVLKFDLDSILILAILRPKGRDHFTLDDLSRGFKTVSRMLSERPDRWPCASVSFLNAKANRLAVGVGAGGGPGDREPSFEEVLRTMFNAGYRGDVYAAPEMWKFGNVGVFPTYPFPAGLKQMREGSS